MFVGLEVFWRAVFLFPVGFIIWRLRFSAAVELLMEERAVLSLELVYSPTFRLAFLSILL